MSVGGGPGLRGTVGGCPFGVWASFRVGRPYWSLTVRTTHSHLFSTIPCVFLGVHPCFMGLPLSQAGPLSRVTHNGVFGVLLHAKNRSGLHSLLQLADRPSCWTIINCFNYDVINPLQCIWGDVKVSSIRSQCKSVSAVFNFVCRTSDRLSQE